uniref:kelch-like protein 28 n=1 Tax=Styela clava TaxID=7725 RepID=UPI00193940A9|nr:kelch-like protein 28 [Styela clava]
MAANFGIQDNEHNNLMMQKLDDMRKKKRLSDFTIKVGNEEFPVHKNVMSAGSDYFDAMLSHDNLESNTGIVDMKEVDVDSVKICIDYIYTGNALITLEKCEQLLHVANFMQMSRFSEMIAEFLQANLLPKSFFIIRQLALKFSLKGLEVACGEYAVGHLGSIAEEVEFNQFDRNYVVFLLTHDMSSYSEDSKLKILLQWIKYDAETRTEYFIEMVKKLNISKISTSYGSYLAMNDSFCSSCVEFMKLLYLADKSPHKNQEVDVPSHSPLVHGGILLFDGKSEHMKLYQPIIRRSTQFNYCLDFLPKYKYTAVYLQKFVFVLLPGKKVYRVNVWEAKSSWTEMESMMNDHGQYIRAAVHNKFIYVCGNKTMERYNDNTNKWNNVDCSSIKPNRSALVRFRDEIYVIGGFYRGQKVDKYSPSVGSWPSVKAMNVGRQTSAAAVYEDRIYVAGGYLDNHFGQDISSAEFFNPDDNTWTNVASMTIPRDEFSLCVVNNNLFAVGNRSEPYSIEKYNLDKNQWEKVTDLADKEIMSAASIAIRIPLCLEKSCDEYGVIHLGSIAEEVEFNKLDKDYVMFLITYKRSSYSEDSKLSVLLQWIKAEKVYRVSAWEAQSTWTEMENMMKEHGQCIRAAVHNNFIYVCGKKTMERYNNNGNNWENVACSTIEPDESALVTFGDEIYVIGGYNRGKRVDKYSPHIGSWSSVKLMNVGRRTPTAAVYDDRIYVAGGWNGSSYLSSTEFFNPVYNTWTNVASMSIPQDKFGLCVVNKNLFAVEIEFEPYSIKEYDPKKQWKNWTDMEIMTTASIAIRIPLYWFDCL